MDFMTYEEFTENARRNFQVSKDGTLVGHWKPESVDARWKYHAKAIELIRQSDTTDPSKVLEMGTMGAQLVIGSHTIDRDSSWQFEGFNPTYLHDARTLPWPIDDRQYEWFVALRVFQHLFPFQHECFNEARRVAENVLLVVPFDYSRSTKGGGRASGTGITPLQFMKWTAGELPQKWEPLQRFGDMYWWSSHGPQSGGYPFRRATFVTKAGIITTYRTGKRFLRRMAKYAQLHDR